MVEPFERRISMAAVWARRFAWFATVLFVTSGLGHRYGFLATPGFFDVLVVVACVAALSLVLAVIGFSRLWNHGDKAGANIAAAVALAALVLGPFVYMSYRAGIFPPLTDISTDIDNPPDLLQAQTGPAGGTIRPPLDTEQKLLQLENYPQVTGRRYDLPFDRVVALVNTAAKGEGWTILRPADAAAEDGETTLEAVAHTLVLALPSDVAVRLTDEGDSTYVDMRSASRYGNRDFGDNAARIADFMDRLDTDVVTLAGTSPAEPLDDDPPGEEPSDIPVPAPRPSG